MFDFNDPQSLAALQAIGAILSNSGPSLKPQSPFAGVGAGMQAYAEGLNSAKTREAQLKHIDLQNKKLESEQKAQDEIRALFSGAGGEQLMNDPDKLKAMGVNLALRGHTSGSQWIALAEKMKEKQEEQKRLQAMQSSPGILGAGVTLNSPQGQALLGPDQMTGDPEFDKALLQSTNEGLNSNPNLKPQPITPPRAGIMGPLLSSKYVAPAARTAQSMIDNGALKPSDARSEFDRLFALESRQDENARRDQERRDDNAQRDRERQQGREDIVRLGASFRTPADHSPYTNVQADGNGGFVGVNKRTGRVEKIPMAADVAVSGHAPASSKGLSGQEFLDTLPPGDATLVKAVAEGRVLPRDLSTKGGHREQILRLANQYMPGFDAVASAGNAKSYDKLVAQYDAVTSFEKNAVRNGKVLKQLAGKVDTTGVPLIERWIRAGRRETGNDDIAEFGAQLQLYRTEAARILTNPNLTGVLTDAARGEVREFLDGHMSASQIIRVVDRLENDFTNRRQTLEEQMQDNRGRGKNSKGIPSSAPAAPVKPPLNSYERAPR